MDVEKTFDKEDVEADPNKEKEGVELPEQYRNLSAADFVAALEAAKEENAANTQRFGELQQEVLNLAKSRTSGDPPARKAEEEVDFFTKPKEAAEALFEAKMRPYKEAYLNSQEIRQMQDVMKLPYADKYQKEIQAVLAQTDPNVRMVEGTAKAAYHYVMGQHIDDIHEDKKKDKEREPEFVESRSGGGRRQERKATISPEEHIIAEAGGQTDESFMVWRDNPQAMIDKTLNPKKEKTS